MKILILSLLLFFHYFCNIFLGVVLHLTQKKVLKKKRGKERVDYVKFSLLLMNRKPSYTILYVVC